MSLRRIVIIGTTCSGKTTLGKTIAGKLALEAVDLDELHWLPGWQPRALDEARKLVDTATEQPGWVISGNYRRLQDIFWPRADTVIWLDYPFFLVLWRLLKRSFSRMVTRQEVCNGNYETLRKFLSKESLLLWLLQSFPKRKRESGAIFAHPEAHPHLTLIRFKQPREAELWLEKLDGPV